MQTVEVRSLLDRGTLETIGKYHLYSAIDSMWSDGYAPIEPPCCQYLILTILVVGESSPFSTFSEGEQLFPPFLILGNETGTSALKEVVQTRLI